MNARPIQSILNLFQSKGSRRAVSRRGRNTRLSVESLEHRTLLAANIFASAVETLDVNNDGAVSPLDALLVINQLPEDGGAYELAESQSALDISGDGLLSEVDAQLIISRLDSVFAEPRAALAASASARGRGVTQISGYGIFDPEGGYCDDETIRPDGYEWFTMRMYGDLQGCWYTRSEPEPVVHDNGQPSGIYQERGEEIFIELVELDGNIVETGNTFKTTYFFNSKYDPEFAVEINEEGEIVEYGVEVHGRCQHRIVEGTGDFEGATGWVFFKDDVSAGINYYRGHINP